MHSARNVKIEVAKQTPFRHTSKAQNFRIFSRTFYIVMNGNVQKMVNALGLYLHHMDRFEELLFEETIVIEARLVSFFQRKDVAFSRKQRSI